MGSLRIACGLSGFAEAGFAREQPTRSLGKTLSRLRWIASAPERAPVRGHSLRFRFDARGDFACAAVLRDVFVSLKA